MDDDLHEELRPRDNPEGISLFEIKARKWAAEDKIVQYANALTEQHQLDPSLAEDIEEVVHEEDQDALWNALARFMKAVVEARGTD